MIRFLLKGLLRDRSRSLFPVLTVTAGVTLSVVAFSWIRGTEADIIRANASFSTGHLKLTTQGYPNEPEQTANELALPDLQAALDLLEAEHPRVRWTPRIRFSGLLDIPDEQGETRAQSPITGLALDLLSSTSPEGDVLNLQRALISGRLPQAEDEILVSHPLAERMGVDLGEVATLIGTTRFGGLTTANLRVVGTIRFGITAVDRGAILGDVRGIGAALDMENSAGEILGFYPDQVYRPAESATLARDFNDRFGDPDDEMAYRMSHLRSDEGLSTLLDLASVVTGALIALFVAVMSIVLWNAGLMGSLRRYGEFGVRLAVGERYGHIYTSLLAESMAIGLIGSILGTALGLSISYYLQVQGVSIAPFLKNASLLISDVLRARVSAGSFTIGLIPGLLATILGAAISGLGIYQRKTSQLAKEFEG
jgi:putative ABC transport system permease protein